MTINEVEIIKLTLHPIRDQVDNRVWVKYWLWPQHDAMQAIRNLLT